MNIKQITWALVLLVSLTYTAVLMYGVYAFYTILSRAGFFGGAAFAIIKMAAVIALMVWLSKINKSWKKSQRS